MDAKEGIPLEEKWAWSPGKLEEDVSPEYDTGVPLCDAT